MFDDWVEDIVVGPVNAASKEFLFKEFIDSHVTQCDLEFCIFSKAEFFSRIEF